MHQTVTTPRPTITPQMAKKRRLRRKRYIIFGSIGLLLLWIIVSIILSKREKTISVQEYNAAQAAYDVAKNTYESSLHEIERAQAGSSQARDALSKTTVYSPIDGTVTILNSKLGERIVATGQFAGTEVMRVADLGHMESRIDVNENDVVNVKVGDKAKVKVDAYGDRKFHGTVYQIG